MLKNILTCYPNTMHENASERGLFRLMEVVTMSCIKSLNVFVVLLSCLGVIYACGESESTSGADGDGDSIESDGDGDSETDGVEDVPLPVLSVNVESSSGDADDEKRFSVTVRNEGDVPAYNVRVTPESEAAIAFGGAFSESTILDTYDGEQGRAWLEKRGGLLFVHISGDHYQMGFQHGVLLGEALLPVFNGLVTTTAMELGFGSLETGLGWLEEMKEAMEPYTPAKYIEEMHGIADGAATVGCPLDFDDIFMLNLIIDAGLVLYKLAPVTGMDVTVPYDLEYGPDCSGFTVWGGSTQDGEMISAAIQEYKPYRIDAFGGTEVTALYRGLLLVGRPTEGYNFLVPTVPGMVGIAQGLNAAGISTSSKGSNSIHATMCGCAISFESREIAQYAGNIDDAIDFLAGPHARARGHNRQVDDSAAGRSVVLEVSASELALREGNLDDAVIAANHFRAWPGFEGYPDDGHNMVLGQFAFGSWGYKTADIETREDWEAILEEKATRYNFYASVIGENDGNIDTELAKEWLSRNRGDGHYAAAEWSEIFSDAALYKTEERGDIHSTGELGPSHRSVMLPARRSAWISWGLEDLENLGPWVFVNLEIPPGGEVVFEITATSDAAWSGSSVHFVADCDQGVSGQADLSL